MKNYLCYDAFFSFNMKLTAKSARHALEVAKRKGIIAPMVELAPC